MSDKSAGNKADLPERPFVFINAAMSADGKIATIQRKQTRISGSVDFDRMDELRASSDAIMVGIGTVLADNPSLTVKSKERKIKRLEKGLLENPVRIVVDSMARTPVDADFIRKGEGRRIIAVSRSAPVDKVSELSKTAEIICTGDKEVDLKDLLHELSMHGIRVLMVEGGATLNWALISEGLVDEIYTFIGNMIIGGRAAPTLVDGKGFELNFPRLDIIAYEMMEEGILLKWKIRMNMNSKIY